LKLLNIKTSDQQLDLLLEANIEHKHAKQQTSTTKNNAPIKKGLKKEQGLALGSQTRKTLRTELSRDLDHITQGYVLGIF
jgi:hypothetical protein